MQQLQDFVTVYVVEISKPSLGTFVVWIKQLVAGCGLSVIE
jgi:hypothetical protein